MTRPRAFAAAVGVMAFAVSGAVRAESALPTRTLTFQDGATPKFEGDGERLVHGAFELELRFAGLNPLCHAYRVGGPAHRVRLPRRAAMAEAEFAPAAVPVLQDLDAARAALAEAESDLGRVHSAAKAELALDAVWSECDRPGPLSDASRKRVLTAAARAQKELAPDGGWRRAIVQADAVARGAAARARDAESAHAPASERVRQLQTELSAAELAEKEARERRLAAERYGRKAPKAIVEAAEAAEARVADKKRELEQAQGELAKLSGAAEVRERAERLRDEATRVRRQLAAWSADAARANHLLAQAPAPRTQTVRSGETAKIEVTRVALKRGKPHGRPERFESKRYEALHPILLDVGVGPAVTFKYTEAWGLAVGPSRSDPVAKTRVVRTEEELNLDGVVSLSGYIWGARYLDDQVFAWKQLLPRPMVGLSMRQPFSSLYLGGQIDPVQFLDISAGARWFTRSKLIGPQEGDPALLDHAGNPAAPKTQDEVTVAPFVAITVSTDFVHRWLKRGL